MEEVSNAVWVEQYKISQHKAGNAQGKEQYKPLPACQTQFH
jgi:hypothetical protein